jgi:uncharacterized YceG family protein
VSGYGPGGHTGRGYGAPDYEGDPGAARPRRPDGAQPSPDGSVWQSDQGHAAYDAPGYGVPGYGAQDYRGQESGREGPGYRGQPYGDYGQRGYDRPGYGQPAHPGQVRPGFTGQPARASHDQGGYDQGGYDQGGTGARPVAGEYDQRGGEPPAGSGGYPGGGYGNWEQEPEDSPFLPGFDRRDDSSGERPGGYAAEPGRYDGYGDQRTPRGGVPAGPDPEGWGPAGGSGGSGGLRFEPRDGDDGRGDRDRKPRKKATRWLPRILVLAVVAVVVIGGLVGGLDVYHKYETRYHPADYAGAGTGDATVQVMSGDTAFSLAPRLLQLGVIASTRAFTNAAEAATSTDTSSTGLETGYYQLHHHMQASLAYAALTNPKNLVQTTVTIPEGKRAVDVIAIIAEKTKIPLKNFQQVLAHPAQLGLPPYADGKVEGYLFPATYAIVPHETALQILQAMVQRFNVEAQQVNLVAEAKTVGLTPTQLIIEASLAQAEGGSVSDYPKIAEVIHNRIAQGMHLQFDSTVLYGLGKYAVSATIKQTRTPGPYNTYLNAGLPAGPISNPGDAAIQGVLHPDQGNWLYFLTVPDGKSQFSATPLKGQ